jgi:ribosomal protein L37AE/L43A
MTQKPRCPRCGTPNHVVVGSGKYPDRIHYCEKCRGMFDDSDPNEGGDYSDRNPAARMERDERRRA